MRLTIAWFTNRRDPKLDWFLDSVLSQAEPWDDIRFIIVDFYASEPGRLIGILGDSFASALGNQITHVEPMPSVWNGRHRLTKDNWFNAAGARNTAICLCPDDHLVFADDLSVALPGWLNAAKEAVRRGGITLGCYQKVKNLVVKGGIATSFDEFEDGKDHRLKLLPNQDGPQFAYQSWFYGCSFVSPIESLLAIGGFSDALTATHGYEDGVASVMLRNNGITMEIDPRMKTFESEELHHVHGNHFRRWDPCRGDPNARPRDDASHAMMNIASAVKFHPNHFGEEGIRGLRQRVLRGEPFPIMKTPEHHWFTGKHLSEI